MRLCLFVFHAMASVVGIPLFLRADSQCAELPGDLTFCWLLANGTSSIQSARNLPTLADYIFLWAPHLSFPSCPTFCHGAPLDCKLLEVRDYVLGLCNHAALSVVPCEGNEHLWWIITREKNSILEIYLITYILSAYYMLKPTRTHWMKARPFAFISAEKGQV